MLIIDANLIQLVVYRSLLSTDPELALLVKAVINNEARYIFQYPYCGAFQPPPESGLSPSHNDWADGVTVNPCVYRSILLFGIQVRSDTYAFLNHRPVDNQTVFECKVWSDSHVSSFFFLDQIY